jgi:hypothetical protein
VSQVTEDPVVAAREALARHSWQQAYELLAGADHDGQLAPADLEALMEAAWWAARMSASNDAGERAYNAYLGAGDRPGAARAATFVSRNYSAAGQAALGAAWLQRAERALEGAPESAENGRVLRFRAFWLLHQGRAEEAAAFAEEALEIATRHAHPDIQALALQTKGMALVALGRIEEGVALQDEATVAAVSGDLSPQVTGMIYCNAIAECARMNDYRRAGEWTEAAKRWCERQSISGFPGICRIYRAEIMRLRGAWADAEQEAGGRASSCKTTAWTPSPRPGSTSSARSGCGSGTSRAQKTRSGRRTSSDSSPIPGSPW